MAGPLLPAQPGFMGWEENMAPLLPRGKRALLFTKAKPNTVFLKGGQNTTGKKGEVQWCTAQTEQIHSCFHTLVYSTSIYATTCWTHPNPKTQFWETLRDSGTRVGKLSTVDRRINVGICKLVSPGKEFAFYSWCNFEFLMREIILINLLKGPLWLPRRE